MTATSEDYESEVTAKFEENLKKLLRRGWTVRDDWFEHGPKGKFMFTMAMALKEEGLEE